MTRRPLAAAFVLAALLTAGCAESGENRSQNPNTGDTVVPTTGGPPSTTDGSLPERPTQ